MKEITRTIAQALVDAPEQIAVSAVTSDHTWILRLSVSEGDAGKIIGKKGRTIEAMRILLNAVAAKTKKRVVLEITDDDSHSKRSTAKHQPCVEYHRGPARRYAGSVNRAAATAASPLYPDRQPAPLGGSSTGGVGVA